MISLLARLVSGFAVWLIVVVSFAAVFFNQASWAVERFVDDNAGPGNETGTTWANAFVDLQDALAVAVEGDVIRVADGVYVPGDFINEYFVIKPGVSMFGGYAGAYNPEETDPWDNDIVNHWTILSGYSASPVFNTYHVLYADGALIDENTVIDGFTIDQGSATGNGLILHDRIGGGLLCINGAHPTISRCWITSNIAGTGGGIYCQESDEPIVIRDCIINGNLAPAGGGGIYSESGAVIVNCHFSGNQSADDCETSSTGEAGGAILAGTTEVVESVLKVYNSIFHNNCAYRGGGAIYADTDIMELVNCQFTRNTARDYGGGALNVGATSFNMVNCTIAYNEADEFGGGMVIAGSPGATAKNCIFWGNTLTADPPGEGFQIYDPDNNLGFTTCTVQGTSIGPTPTFVDPDNTDIGLQNFRQTCDSLCVNVGTNAAVPADTGDVDNDGNTAETIPWDADKLGRFVDTAVDLGAFEVQYPSCTADVDNTTCVNVDDLLAVIMSWGTCAPPCAADVTPITGFCVGNGTVNVDDLLAVINAWGPCPDGGVCSGPNNDMPETIADCRDMCLEQTEATYEECMEKCLCAIGEIPCN